jgi:8-oxo-dGTP diphosphatase
MNELINKFNIRVYGLIINEKNEVLLSDEFQAGMKMTKFPGGGLNFGESTVGCLMREAMEEFGQPVEVTGHFYTTDFFQESWFFKGAQVLCIYYFAKFAGEIKFKISQKPFDFPEMKNGNQSFRFEKISDLKDDDITLPTDKKALELLKIKFEKENY